MNNERVDDSIEDQKAIAPRTDITRNVLGVLFIVALIGSSVWILRPFLGALVWAGTHVVATRPWII